MNLFQTPYTHQWRHERMGCLISTSEAAENISSGGGGGALLRSDICTRQNPEARMVFRAAFWLDAGCRGVFTRRMCKLRSTYLACEQGILHWDTYVERKIVPDERRCDEGSWWRLAHVSTESQLHTCCPTPRNDWTHTMLMYKTPCPSLPTSKFFLVRVQ